MFYKKIIAALMSVILATMPVTQATELNRPSMKDVYVPNGVSRDEMKVGWNQFIEFLEITEEKSDETIDWSDYVIEYWGNGDFIVRSRLWDEREYGYKKPRATIEERNYLIDILANIIGNIESSNAPDLVQILGMYTALIRYQESDDTFMGMYYTGDNYDYSTFDENAALTKRAIKNAQKVVDDYIFPNKDGFYSLEAPYQLYCQSQNFWGRIILAWYNYKLDEHEYFSDAGRGDGNFVSYMD